MTISLRWFRFGTSQLTLVLLICVFAGITWVRFGGAYTPASLLAGVVITPLLVRKRWLAVIPVLLVGVQIGLWRGEQFAAGVERYEQLYAHEMTLTGRVSDDPGYNKYGQTEFHLSNLVIIDTNEDLRGRIRVRAFRAIGVRRGDTVQVSGKMYPTLGNRQASMGYADVEILSRDQTALESLRGRFFAGVYTALPEPNASLGLGFLVGLRTLLPEELLDELSRTGLTHIVAVSGYNLTVLVRLTRRLFARRSAFISLATSAGLVVSFLLVTGVSPSIARASVISGFALLGWYYGRVIRPSMLLMLGATITAFMNPYFVWFDLGWWLSFAAFFGVLIIAPLITARLFQNKPRLLGQLIIETTSAQIMALPIIAVVFGELSLISLLANVVILPLIPIAMLLTFVAGVAGMLGPFIAGWFALPANTILTFMTDTVAILSNVSWALAEVNITWREAGLFYLITITVVAILFLRSRKAQKSTSFKI